MCVFFSSPRASAGGCTETAEGKPCAGARKTSASDHLIESKSCQNGIETPFSWNVKIVVRTHMLPCNC